MRRGFAGAIIDPIHKGPLRAQQRIQLGMKPMQFCCVKPALGESPVQGSRPP